MSADAISETNSNVDPTAAPEQPIQTIKTADGEIYARGDQIIGRMVVNGNTTSWYRGDKLHREGDLPAHIIADSTSTCETYKIDGELHREGDRPAVIIKAPNGVISYEAYYCRGMLHRDGAPAVIRRDNSGNIFHSAYYQNDKLHREDGPAWIDTSNQGTTERWYINGQLHRDGRAPAEIYCKKDGTVKHKYWRHGRAQSPEVFVVDDIAELTAGMAALIEKLIRVDKQLAVKDAEIAELKQKVEALSK